MSFFYVLDSRPIDSGLRNCALLLVDRWDDWGKYRTMFTLAFVDESGKSKTIGSVKIGQMGLKPSHEISEMHRAPAVPTQFDSLSDSFFSLGQGEDYYESLNELDHNVKWKILAGLRDCAADPELLDRFSEEEVMNESLLREVRASTVHGRFNRLTRGDAKLTRFAFKYTLPQTVDGQPAEMIFDVVPESQPPTNVHVLIGRNGVGKTQCMRRLALALLGRLTNDGASPGTVEMLDQERNSSSEFSGLILVSFSAFDDFDLRALEQDAMSCKQIGLRRSNKKDGTTSSASFEQLGRDFANSLHRCQSGVTVERWRQAVESLEEDDLFAAANVKSLLEERSLSEADWKADAQRLFKRLSSGHAIVLLTITRLVELVDERTLVLLDEPEGHLHPPLLASFIRCLSNLLFRRNGVAIVATHSPVVLQEVPRSCAWKLRRSREVTVTERPTLETFGENIGVLTREVFGLQVTKSGFHRLLEKEVNKGGTYGSIVSAFSGQIGDEAKAIIRALIAERDRRPNA